MKLVFLLYLFGLLPVLAGVYLTCWSTTQALWENPTLTGIPEDWPYDLQLKNQVVLYPYAELGVTLLMCGFTAFYLSPTVAWLVAKKS